MAPSLSERLITGIFRVINRRYTWFQFPFPLSLINLLCLRGDLRWRNVFVTETVPLNPAGNPPRADIRHCRTDDGSFNDLKKTWMVTTRARVGRNAPLPDTFGENPPALYEPNPRLISCELLARREFRAAKTLNALLPAWLQFMVHDWLSHGFNDTKAPHCVAVPPDDHDWPQREITILRTCPDAQQNPADEGRPATYRNAVTHWWDASQVYGSDLKTQREVRSGKAGLRPDGKLELDAEGYLPIDSHPSNEDPEQELAAVNGNWWVGLSVMHTLFTREHN